MMLIQSGLSQEFIDRLETLDLNLNSPSKSLSNNTFIYVVSNSVYATNQMFKIGKHKGSKKALIRRYKTYLIEPQVYCFFPTGSASSDESILLQRLAHYRVGNSEFVKMEIDRLLDMIQTHFKQKYIRSPSVKIKYSKALHQGQKIVLDFEDKTIQPPMISFFPFFNFNQPDNCLQAIQIKSRDGQVSLEIKMDKFNPVIEESQDKYLVEFLKCFFIQFEKQFSYLHLDSFEDGFWVRFFVFVMQKYFDFHSFKILSRREFLIKESFHERILFVKKDSDDVPIEIVLEKAQLIQTCIVFEDKNFYSIDARETIWEKDFDAFFYYLFYIL